MRLSGILCRFIRRRHVPGNIYTGKNRVERRVTPMAKAAAARQILFEQQNLETISNPYLTEGEEEDYKVVEEMRAQEKWCSDYIKEKEERMFKNRFMNDHLEHLNVSKKWE